MALYNPAIQDYTYIMQSVGVGGAEPVGISAPNAVVIDGTPIRVVVLAVAAAAGLTALKWAGFRFNVGVSA
jgi:hypothetical protein